MCISSFFAKISLTNLIYGSFWLNDPQKLTPKINQMTLDLPPKDQGSQVTPWLSYQVLYTVSLWLYYILTEMI